MMLLGEISNSPNPLGLFEYVFLAASSLFVIIDPISAVPSFLAMTPNDSPQTRTRMARLACIVATGILLSFAYAGKWIFSLLGITITAFQMAGSVVMMLVALDMLRARRSPVQETREEKDAGTEKQDIAITPLAVPILVGPGAISTAILLHNKAVNLQQEIALIFCILAVCGSGYLILALSARGAKWLSPIALRLTERLMGLLLAAIAMQFLINALRDLKIIPA
jgi:multiple antibiotic resistance protein